MKIACGYTIPITLFGLPPSPIDHLKAMEIVGQAGFEAIELVGGNVSHGGPGLNGAAISVL